MQNILSKYIFFSQALDHNLQIWIFVEQDTSFYDGNEIFDLLDCMLHHAPGISEEFIPLEQMVLLWICFEVKLRNWYFTTRPPQSIYIVLITANIGHCTAAYVGVGDHKN